MGLRVVNKNANATSQELTDPLGAEVMVDGQMFYVGPNERKVIPGTSGRVIGDIVNQNAAAQVKEDNSASTLQFPNTEPSKS